MSRTPSRISLLLADVDGTLVTHAKVLTHRARQAVADLRKAGIRFAVTSGRPPRGMRMIVKALAIDTPIAGFNGGLYTDAAFSPIEEHKIPPDAAQAVLAMIADEGLDVWIYSGNDWLVRDANAPHVERERNTVDFAPTVVPDFADLIGATIKIVGVSDDNSRIQRCTHDIQERFGRRVTASLSQPYYLDVTHPNANKGAVVEELARRLNIPMIEIATIGDMENDVSMFEKGGFAIAMGNADHEVQGAADAVTADCDHEGFATAVETFVLPRAKGRP
jgi:Cof subfamily protein (haloacid dehalogenase superfamily)